MLRSSSLLKRSLASTSRLYSSFPEIRVGFIGLGNMGYSMAKNIALASDETLPNKKLVMVFDIDKEQERKLVSECKADSKAVVKAADSVDDIANTCNVVITMLPATKHVEGVMYGEAGKSNGLLNQVCDGALLIDCSTIDPLASQALHATAVEQKKGIKVIDAPVSGGVTGAAAGTLTFMVGGEIEAIGQAKSVLSTMGKNIVHCGTSGAGGIAKLCNNMALAIGMIGTSEAMAMGTSLGMDPKVLASVMNTSTARCWSSDTYNPVPGISPNAPANRDYAGGFGVGLMEKDLGLAMNLATKIRARTPLGTNAHQLYGVLSDHGFIDKDFSVVYKFLSEKTKEQ